MEWLRFSGLERSYGARTIFSGLDGVLRDATVVGLVGPNGAGKSSLVRIVVGSEHPDSGTIVRKREARLGYLSQTANADAGITLRELLGRAFARIHEQEARLRELETAVSEAADDETMERALDAYGSAREVFDRHDGASLERRMRAMLSAFAFEESDLDRPTSAFSGGQRTRASLARLLLEDADVLVLDEPTNHLDLATVRWLEEFIVADGRPALVVSHDRTFIDRVATEIWELDGGSLERYEVPRGRAYGAYLEEKAARHEQAMRDYERFRDEERRRKAVIAELKTHGSHNYSHVRSREKQLGKLDRVEAPETSQQRIHVKLEAVRRATNGVALRTHDLAASYDTTLFDHLTMTVKRGERIAIVGPNGAGKSTLLDVLAGRRAAEHGTVEIATGVRSAYFAQDTTDDLAPGATAVDAVLEGATIVPEEARALLGRLGLGGDAGDKPVEAFSGGERRRIMLARLMARAADLLFLDEPTNDLDIPSREALEAVLASYGGAMLVVSHDRYLLRRLAERVLVLDGGRATMLDGGYERYEAFERGESVEAKPTKTPAKSAKPVAPAPPVETNAKSERERRQAIDRNARAVAAAEREVARLDEERARLEREFADPAIYDDRERVAVLERELAEVRAAVEAAFERWESLSSARENVLA